MSSFIQCVGIVRPQYFEPTVFYYLLCCQYTWTYVPFDECVVPLQHVGLDVLGDNSNTVEYTVEGHCNAEDFLKPECVDVRDTVIEAEHGGDVVYVVSHLHTYSLGSSVWGEDGRLICDSSPIYGHEANTPGQWFCN